MNFAQKHCCCVVLAWPGQRARPRARSGFRWPALAEFLLARPRSFRPGPAGPVTEVPKIRKLWYTQLLYSCISKVFPGLFVWFALMCWSYQTKYSRELRKQALIRKHSSISVDFEDWDGTGRKPNLYLVGPNLARHHGEGTVWILPGPAWLGPSRVSSPALIISPSTPLYVRVLGAEWVIFRNTLTEC